MYLKITFVSFGLQPRINVTRKYKSVSFVYFEDNRLRIDVILLTNDGCLLKWKYNKLWCGFTALNEAPGASPFQKNFTEIGW